MKTRLSIGSIALVAVLAGAGCGGEVDIDDSEAIEAESRPDDQGYHRCSTRHVTTYEAQLMYQEAAFRASLVAAALPQTVTVPVYFHVIRKGTGAANGDVTDAQIANQLKVLNDSYGGSTGGLATRYRFTLAGTDRT